MARQNKYLQALRELLVEDDNLLTEEEKERVLQYHMEKKNGNLTDIAFSRVEALNKYKLMKRRSLRKLSDLTGVHYDVLREWAREDKWQDEIKQFEAEVKEKFHAEAVEKIVESGMVGIDASLKAIEGITDKLDVIIKNAENTGDLLRAIQALKHSTEIVSNTVGIGKDKNVNVKVEGDMRTQMVNILDELGGDNSDYDL